MTTATTAARTMCIHESRLRQLAEQAGFIMMPNAELPQEFKNFVSFIELEIADSARVAVQNNSRVFVRAVLQEMGATNNSTIDQACGNKNYMLSGAIMPMN